jgi:hypothetical protein
LFGLGWIETRGSQFLFYTLLSLNPSSASAGKSKTPPQNTEGGIFRKMFGFGWIETTIQAYQSHSLSTLKPIVRLRLEKAKPHLKLLRGHFQKDFWLRLD